MLGDSDSLLLNGSQEGMLDDDQEEDCDDDERISQKIVLFSSFLNVGNKFNALFSEIKYRHVGFL